MKKPSVKQVIIDFLYQRLQYGNNEVSSHHFESTLPQWGEKYWDVRHNPSTYSRAWRSLKSGNELEKIDVTNVIIKNTTTKERTWILVQNM